MRDPVGVILAGGQGRRIGGAKATVSLGGRPLLHYPLSALRAALGPTATVVVVAKPDSMLPPVDGVAVWHEPSLPAHPLVGLVRALQGADGRPVLVCPVDLPFLTVPTLARLGTAPAGDAVAVLACSGGALQPLLGRWEAAALDALMAALAGGEPLPAMRGLAQQLGVRRLEVTARELENVNTAEDLQRARARLISRR